MLLAEAVAGARLGVIVAEQALRAHVEKRASAEGDRERKVHELLLREEQYGDMLGQLGDIDRVFSDAPGAAACVQARRAVREASKLRLDLQAELGQVAGWEPGDLAPPIEVANARRALQEAENAVPWGTFTREDPGSSRRAGSYKSS